ncbi:MAG: SGNH/GDSL hydrolase family protein [Chloroflexi bacterium]|nr:SGNH/GDSL hydrolase family protein [Chloroflexota bacterium]
MPHPRHLALTFLTLSGLLIVLSACSSGTSTSSSARTTDRTAATPTEPSLAPPVAGSYAALGASETYGVGAEPHTRGYAYLVGRALGARHFVDEGIPGAILTSAYDVELSNALAIRPSLCTVFFGFNDINAGITRDAFLQDLHDLVVTLRRARAQVLVIGLPDLSLVPAARHIAHLHQTLTSWNDGMRKVAKGTGARFLDLRNYSGELAAHPNYISADGLHPSNAGHARLAQIVVQAIRADHLWRRS